MGFRSTRVLAALAASSLERCSATPRAAAFASTARCSVALRSAASRNALVRVRVRIRAKGKG